MNFKFWLVDLLKRSILAGLRPIGKTNQLRVASLLAEKLTPTVRVQTGQGLLSFHAYGLMPRWRAESLLTKEPETISWIDGFNGDFVLWDIGANIGAYSLYAALRPGACIVAFEPSAFNYAILMKNIELNAMDEVISAYCIALSDETCNGYFYMSNTDPGSALNSFGSAAEPTRASGNIKFKHAMLGFALDEFIARFSPPFPNYLKIDVDGNEARIIKGARRTLSDPRLRSILVEIDEEPAKRAGDLISSIEEVGFRLRWKEHSAMFAHGTFETQFNYIFDRA